MGGRGSGMKHPYSISKYMYLHFFFVKNSLLPVVLECDNAPLLNKKTLWVLADINPSPPLLPPQKWHFT